MVQVHGTTLVSGEIQINGQPYILSRQQSQDRLGLPARRWQEERLRVSTRVEQRPDVLPGPIKEEYVIIWNDWSKGVAGLHDPQVGTVHKCYNIDPTQPGALRQIGVLQSYTETTTPCGGDCVWVGRHGGVTYGIMGRLSAIANNLSPGDALTLDKDFGAGQVATDTAIYEGFMYVAFGDIALVNKTLTKNYKLWKRTTNISGTTWTQSTHTGAVTFTGAGLNDMSLDTTHNFYGDTTTNIRVEIDASAPSPDTFKWSSDGGSTWTATGVACSTSATTLSPGAVDQGIRIKFAAVDGHTIGDHWDFTCTGVPHAHYMTVVRNKLWRGINYDSAATAATAKVSNISAGNNPETLANWGGTSIVGDANVPITDLNALGERLAVSKETGLYFGDDAAVFPNALPQIESSIHPDNGKQTLVRGGEMVYPYRGGLLEYGFGQSGEIGLERALLDCDTQDNATFGQPPTTRVTAAVMQGDSIWVATEPSYLPRAMPDKIHFYDASAAAFTADETGKTTDSSYVATSALTAARGMQATDYIYVGYSAQFYGVVIELLKVNANDSNTVVEYSKGSSAWGTLPKSTEPATVAIIGTETVNLGLNRAFSRSGVIAWGDLPSDWATDTVNSTASKYWVRISVSANQEATTPDIAEVRVVVSQPVCYVFRGRHPRTWFERPGYPYIWEPICAVTGVSPSITAMTVASNKSMPYRRGESLIMGTRNKIIIHERNFSNWDQAIQEQGNGYVFFSKHDGGMPEVTKQWMRVTVKGNTIDSNHVVQIHYRTDETVAWTQLTPAISTSGQTNAFSSISGKSIQFKFIFNAILGTKGAAAVNTEINEVEVAFRPLWSFKNQFKALLEVADNQATSEGGYLPDASVQLSNLESVHSSGPVALIDPTGRSYTVTLDDMTVVEHVQTDRGYPALLVQVMATEI